MAGNSIATLKAMLTLDTSKWMSGFSSAEKTATQFVSGAGSKFSSWVGGLGSQLGVAVAGFVSVGSALQSLGAGMKQVDRNAELADRLGITVGEVQKLSLVATQAGTDIETLSTLMLKMGKNIGSGGGSLFDRLLNVADSISKIGDAGKRAEMVSEVFGKGGYDIFNVLISGGRGIRASADAIDKMDLAISRMDAAKIEKVNDSWDEMKTILSGVRNLIAVQLAPTVSGFLGDWNTGMEVLSNSIRNVSADLSEMRVNVKQSADDYAKWYDNILAALGAGPGIGFGEIKEGLRNQRRDADRNMMNAGRQTGAGLLGKLEAEKKSSAAIRFASGAAEKGSVEAGRLIQGAVQDMKLRPGEKLIADKLDAIKANTDPRRQPGGTPVRRARM